MVESAAYSRRGYQGGCVATTVPSGLAAGATSAVLADASTWAGLLTNGNARLMLGRTTATPEEIEISGLAGNTITIAARGLQGTSDTTHAAGVSIEVIHSPRDFNEANAHIADTTLDHHTQYVKKSLYDANSILAATTDDTPVALTVGASTIVARLASGGIVAATPAQLRTLLDLVIGTNVQAWDADLDDIAAIADATGDIIIRGSSGWERLAKSATATDVLAAGATKPEWVAAPSSGAMTYEGGNSTEFSTSSTTPVDLVTISGLSIAAGKPLMIVVNWRRTGTTNVTVSLGLKVNSTVLGDPSMTGVAAASAGIATLMIGPGETNYGFASNAWAGGTSSGHAETVGFVSAVRPAATVTSITIRGGVSNAADTFYVKDVRVYSLAVA